MKVVDVERLRRIAEVEFSDIVLDDYTWLNVTSIRILNAHCASF
jgi:hypothetical protein